MKKIILLSAGALLLSLTSCKKTYTCVCTGNPGTTSNNEYTFTIKDKESKAEETCKAYMPTYTECHITK